MSSAQNLQRLKAIMRKRNFLGENAFISYFLLHLILFPRDKLVLMFSEMTTSQLFVVPYSSSQETEKLS